MSHDAHISPAPHLAQRLALLSLADRLIEIRRAVPGRIVLTTSLGLEDQALTHAVLSQRLDIEVVTLETGRLFAQTYDVWAATEARYGQRIRAFYPDTDALEALVARDGINGLRQTVDARKACCAVRKIAPLRRALAGASAWITGLRADQSPDRMQAGLVEEATDFGVLKLNPLIDWSRAAIEAYVTAHDIPVNALHAQGFLSIGCAPCTRAVASGETERAGRWWWEQVERKECGLHAAPDGSLRHRPEKAASA